MTKYIAFSSIPVPPNFLVRTMQPAEYYVAPLFEPAIAPGTHVIDIVNTGAFGSGAHPTTQLCLTALAEYITPQSSVLDLGCGSGVLAIGAAKLGAAKIVAVDIEQAAVIRTRDNAAMNDVADRIDVRLGSTELVQQDIPFDIVAANLLTPVFLKLAPLLPPLLGEHGIGVFSGILDVQVDRVRAALADVGLHVRDTRTQRGWCALIVGTQPV